jgi:hypothetical protein
VAQVLDASLPGAATDSAQLVPPLGADSTRVRKPSVSRKTENIDTFPIFSDSPEEPR